MKNVLIVSPHFPPVNAPDMHRVRTSLPYFRDFGWQPFVLAVGPEHQQGVIEPRLEQSLPAGVPVERTGALPRGLTSRFGIGNVALRAFGHLYSAGARMIRHEKIDLVYFSTTMFAAMPLGRVWQSRFGTPYVLDMQDPWVDDAPAREHRLPKHRQARALHRVLEPFTMRGVSGLIAVSEAYTDTLRRRYPWISEDLCATIPFGACEADFEEAARGAWRNPFFRPDDGAIHGVYAGAVSDAMRLAARIFFRALRKAGAQSAHAAKVRMSFAGTSYAADRGQPMVEADARAEGLGEIVHESPARLPYFDALRLVLDGGFLLILGSEDPSYMPSKLFQYLLAKRPIVAVLHERSSAIDLLRRSRAAVVTTFSRPADLEDAAARLSVPLADLLQRFPFVPDTDWSVVAPFTARELTRRQCGIFDGVLARVSAAREHAANGRQTQSMAGHASDRT